MESDMDESRKQFEESWLRRGGESSDLIRYPENHHEIGSGNIGGQYVMDDVQRAVQRLQRRGRHREQLLNWISTGPNRMTTFGKMVKKVLMRWVMRMGVTKR